MSFNQNYRYDFQINAYLPQLIRQILSQAQAQFNDVRIWFENNAKGNICGFIEGQRDTIEKMRLVLMKMLEKLGIIGKAIFSEMKQLKNYAKETVQENWTQESIV